MSQMIKISVVAPFYNEGDGVTHFYREMCSIFASLSQYDFELVCVDDGSSDDTLSRLIELSNTDNRVKVIEFSRNFGKRRR